MAGLGLEAAAAVEDQRRAADERGERRGHLVEAALAQDDPLQALVAAIERCSSAYCSLTRRVNACSVIAMNGSS